MELSEFIDSIDIVQLASQFTDLTEKNGEFWGISPITYPPERTPSFSVRRETNSFYDFSSGVGGTAVTLVEYCKKITKHEAIEWLKQYCGKEGIVVSQQLAASKVGKQFAPPRKTQKQSSKQVSLPDNYMEQYERRDDKLAVWEAEGISREALQKFDVRYDSFSDRLVYPIRGQDGKIVNVGGRTLDPKWKEKNLRKYTYFRGWEGGMGVIYGLWENMKSIKEKKEVIIFEGCKSVLLADTYGFYNTAALLTSHLSPKQMKLLIKLGCRVVFALDKDVDIRDDYNIKQLRQFVNVQYVYDKNDLLGEKDSPVDKGKDVWKKLYEERRRY